MEKKDNLIEIFEEEARVKHGGPLKSRRKTGKMAPELGEDYVPFENIPHQHRQSGGDIGFEADSQAAIGENEVIDEIDEKIRQEKILKSYMEQQPKKREFTVWHAKKQSKKEEDSENKASPKNMPSQYSPKRH